MANADVRAEWDELPGFAYGHINRHVWISTDALTPKKKSSY